MNPFYKQFFLFVIFFIGIKVNAQISVIATLGTPGPTNYSTLKTAFDAINLGTHRGSITISINSNTTESASAVLNSSGTGSTSYTAVLIRPTNTATISGNIAGPLVDLNGAKNVIIDGRIGSTGSTRSLVITNLSTSGTAGTSTIRMINTQNNTITFTNINGSSKFGTAAMAATILFDKNLTGSGNSNITISNNEIGAAGGNTPSVAIYSIGGSGTALNSNITISDNYIHDYFNSAEMSAGILADTYSNAWVITGNSFYQSTVKFSIADIFHGSIYLKSGNGHIVNNNFIGGSAFNTGGTATTISGGFSNRFYGIIFNVGTTIASTANGNIITNLNFSSTPSTISNVFTGIQVDQGNVNIGVTEGNTIGSLTGTNAITLNISGTINSFNYGIVSFAETMVNIRNNKVGSISTIGSSTGIVVLRGIEASSYNSLTVEGNIIGGNSPSSIQANTSNNRMGGIFLYQSQNNTTSVVNNNVVRNFTNNATGANSAEIIGIKTQVQVMSIQVFNTVTNNLINNLNSPVTSATVGEVVGIKITDTTGVIFSGSDGNFNNNTISFLSAGSTYQGFLVRGIHNFLSHPNFLNINENIIHNIISAAPNTNSLSGVASGIYSNHSSPGSVSIAGNTIYNIEATASGAGTSVIGISIFRASSASSVLISRNKIYDLRNQGASGTGLVNGIMARGSGVGSGNGTFNIVNNMISLNSANVAIFGISNPSVAAAVNVYFNSVYIGGIASGSNNSAAYSRVGVSTTTILKNNIFYNFRTGGTGLAFAIANTNSTPGTGWSSDYNDLYTTNAANTALWGTAVLDLSSYKASATDVNSLSVPVTFVNNLVGDLHLIGASISDVNLNGVPITGVIFDFDNDTRNAISPKIGADEFPSGCSLPAITNQPSGLNACAGTSVNFGVTASGTGLVYQWKKGTSDIPGANASTFTIASVGASDAGNYNVVITNGCGSVTSADAILAVTEIPVITNQPTAVTACNGSQASFSVVATGTGLNYQWRKDGNDIVGATSSTYTITSVTAANAGNYTVRVLSELCSVTSNLAALSISPLPNVISQPTSVTICIGNQTSFSIGTTGTGLTYQWRKDGTDLAGATSSSYSIPAVTAAHAGTYAVLVSSGSCSFLSNSATLTIGPSIVITTQPQSVTTCLQQSATFSVIATGTSLNYQWQYNGTDIPGAAISSLTINNITAAFAGAFRVKVFSNSCSITSNEANLIVSGPCTSIPSIDEDITSVVLMPNVVNNATTLRVNAGRSTRINWTVVDMSGKVVMSFDSQVSAGQNDIKVIVSRLGAGTYHIIGQSAKGRTEVLRMIKS